MDIHSVPWQQQMTVNWENVKCDKGLADDMVMATEEEVSSNYKYQIPNTIY